VKKHKIKIGNLLPGHKSKLWAANNSPIQVVGSAYLNIRIKGLNFPIEALVIKELSDNSIVGTDWMQTYRVKLDYQYGTATFDDLLQVPFTNSQTKLRVVRVLKSICIPSHSEAIIPVTIHKSFIGKDILLQPLPTKQFTNFATARSINHPTSSDSVCRILNFHNSPLILRKGEAVAMVTDAITPDRFSFENNVRRLSSEIPTQSPNISQTPTESPSTETLEEF